MSRRKIDYSAKIRRAAQLLLVQRHRKPGVKGWELKRALGRNYLEIIKLLDEELAKFGFKIKIVFQGEVDASKAKQEDYDKAYYVVTFREPAKVSDIISAGWRIDDLGALAAVLAVINSRGGRVNRRDIEKILGEKLPKWRVDYLIDKFLRFGYLEDEDGYLKIGWRARVEIDLDKLSMLILATPIKESKKSEFEN